MSVLDLFGDHKIGKDELKKFVESDINRASDLILELVQNISDQRSTNEKLNKDIEDLNCELTSLRRKYDLKCKELDETTEFYLENEKVTDKEINNLKTASKQRKSVEDDLKVVKEQLKDIKKERTQLRNTIKSYEKSLAKADKQVDKLNEEIVKLKLGNEEMDNLKNEIKRLKEINRTAKQNVQLSEFLNKKETFKKFDCNYHKTEDTKNDKDNKLKEYKNQLNLDSLFK